MDDLAGRPGGGIVPRIAGIGVFLQQIETPRGTNRSAPS
jgi:hypothetical protein